MAKRLTQGYTGDGTFTKSRSTKEAEAVRCTEAEKAINEALQVVITMRRAAYKKLPQTTMDKVDKYFIRCQQLIGQISTQCEYKKN